jgi:hypothetical protein
MAPSSIDSSAFAIVAKREFSELFRRERNWTAPFFLIASARYPSN